MNMLYEYFATQLLWLRAGTGVWGGERPPELGREPQSIAVVYIKKNYNIRDNYCRLLAHQSKKILHQLVLPVFF